MVVALGLESDDWISELYVDWVLVEVALKLGKLRAVGLGIRFSRVSAVMLGHGFRHLQVEMARLIRDPP